MVSSILTRILLAYFLLYILIFLNAEVYGSTKTSPKSPNLTPTDFTYLSPKNETGSWKLLLIRNNADNGNNIKKLIGSDDENWLKDLAVPIAAAIIASVAASWNFIQAQYRKRAFEQLILRELEELFPNNERERTGKLRDHLNKKLMHKFVFEKFQTEMKNRNFIFSIDPSLVYYVNQLWDAYDKNNVKKWLHVLYQLAQYKDRLGRYKYDKKWDIWKAYGEWLKLIGSYIGIEKEDDLHKFEKDVNSSFLDGKKPFPKLEEINCKFSVIPD